MERNKPGFTTAFLLLLILVISGVMQVRLKSFPQVFIIVFSVITLLSFLQKYKNISKILFFSLVGTLLSFGIFITTVWFLNFVFPESNVIDVNGEEKYVTNMMWVFGIPVALIVTPLVLFYYHKFNKENTKMEILFLVLFIILTSINFFKT